jgi:hypothetical protein
MADVSAVSKLSNDLAALMARDKDTSGHEKRIKRLEDAVAEIKKQLAPKGKEKV